VKIYSAKEAAAELGTDGRTLRRFLRTPDSGFTPVGSGGSYSFSTADMPKLKTAFSKWNTRPSRNAVKTARDGQPLITDAPGVSARVANSKARKDRATVQKLTTERLDRLEAALKAAGLHISQMRDRDSWAPRAKANA
jgi:hypothetical protein